MNLKNQIQIQKKEFPEPVVFKFPAEFPTKVFVPVQSGPHCDRASYDQINIANIVIKIGRVDRFKNCILFSLFI